MHVQAFKLASLFAALDWVKTADDAPTVTVDHWQAAQALAEGWRASAHRLLEQLDRSGEATIERRQQERMLTAIRSKSSQGIELRDLYRQMHVTAKVGRQVAQELVKAGLVVEARINGAEAYIAIEHLSAQ
jgi:predicted transcriptional regulator